ncbi:MAG: glycosyltransferase family 9 protein [Chloroflexi bacterium]|nr:glycosyltransferase family 9 protein [Chloroflexota bacterium]
MSEAIQNILFVELLGGVDEMLLALPAIHAIANSHGDTRLTVLTFASNAELLEKDSLVSRVLVAPSEGMPGDYSTQADYLRQVLENEVFDVVVSDTRRGGIDRIVENSNVKRKISSLWRLSGGSSLANGQAENQRVEQIFVSTLVGEGLVDPSFHDLPGRIALSDDEQQWAKVWLRNNLPKRGDIVILYPEAEMAINVWPSERFVELGKWLTKEAGLSVIVAAREDIRQTEEIALHIGGDAMTLPKIALRKFVALVAQSAIFVSADTVAARIAAAAGPPAIVMFGPTWADRLRLRSPSINLRSSRVCAERRPLNLVEQSCWQSGVCVFPDVRSCVEDISVDIVIGELGTLLQRGVDDPGKDGLH